MWLIISAMRRPMTILAAILGGAPKDTKRLTGMFSVVVVAPRTPEQIAKNPLGIYVHSFSWSQDLSPGESK